MKKVFYFVLISLLSSAYHTYFVWIFSLFYYDQIYRRSNKWKTQKNDEKHRHREHHQLKEMQDTKKPATGLATKYSIHNI